MLCMVYLLTAHNLSLYAYIRKVLCNVPISELEMYLLLYTYTWGVLAACKKIELK
jgi:hypothetical protein